MEHHQSAGGEQVRDGVLCGWRAVGGTIHDWLLTYFSGRVAAKKSEW